jgi:hypothetical protein
MSKKKIKILIPLISILLFFSIACFVVDKLGFGMFVNEESRRGFEEVDEKWKKSVADAEEEIKKEKEPEIKKEDEDTGAKKAEMFIERFVRMGFYKPYYDGVEKADWVIRDDKGEIIDVGKFESPEEGKELKGTIVFEGETESGLPLTIIINLDTGEVSGSSDYISSVNVEWEGNTCIGAAISCNCNISGNINLNTKEINASCLGTCSFLILDEETEEDYEFDLEGTLIEYDTKAIGTLKNVDGTSESWHADLVNR